MRLIAKIRNRLVWEGRSTEHKGQADMVKQLAEVYGVRRLRIRRIRLLSSTADTVAGTTAVTAAGSTISERIVTQTALGGKTVTRGILASGMGCNNRGAPLAEGCITYGERLC